MQLLARKPKHSHLGEGKTMESQRVAPQTYVTVVNTSSTGFLFAPPFAFLFLSPDLLRTVYLTPKQPLSHFQGNPPLVTRHTAPSCAYSERSCLGHLLTSTPQFPNCQLVLSKYPGANRSISNNKTIQPAFCFQKHRPRSFSHHWVLLVSIRLLESAVFPMAPPQLLSKRACSDFDGPYCNDDSSWWWSSVCSLTTRYGNQSRT